MNQQEQVKVHIISNNDSNKQKFKNDADTIYWNNKKLRWDDFKATPSKDSEYSSSSETSIDWSYSNINDTVYVRIRAVFICSKSWSTTKYDSLLLSHEQRHFDLTEIYARKLCEYLHDHKYLIIPIDSFYYSSFSLKLDSIYYSFVNQLNGQQDKYDSETSHSVNQKEQRRWNMIISKKLKELKPCCNE